MSAAEGRSVAAAIARVLHRRPLFVETDNTTGLGPWATLRELLPIFCFDLAPGERKTLHTATATIGIRGTAVYMEADETRTYVCTCYGEAEIASVADPSAREVVRTKHHEQPRYVMAGGAPQMLMGAPVVNHSDAEVTMLEGLVGRRPPFLDMPGYRPRY